MIQMEYLLNYISRKIKSRNPLKDGSMIQILLARQPVFILIISRNPLKDGSMIQIADTQEQAASRLVAIPLKTGQ